MIVVTHRFWRPHRQNEETSLADRVDAAHVVAEIPGHCLDLARRSPETILVGLVGDGTGRVPLRDFHRAMLDGVVSKPHEFVDGVRFVRRHEALDVCCLGGCGRVGAVVASPPKIAALVGNSPSDTVETVQGSSASHPVAAFSLGGCTLLVRGTFLVRVITLNRQAVRCIFSTAGAYLQFLHHSLREK